MHNELKSMAESHRRMNQNGEPAAINRLKSLKFRAQGCQGWRKDAQGHVLSWLVGDVSLPHDLLDPADVVQLCQGMSGSHTVACALAGVHIIM